MAASSIMGRTSVFYAKDLRTGELILKLSLADPIEARVFPCRI